MRVCVCVCVSRSVSFTDSLNVSCIVSRIVSCSSPRSLVTPLARRLLRSFTYRTSRSMIARFFPTLVFNECFAILTLFRKIRAHDFIKSVVLLREYREFRHPIFSVVSLYSPFRLNFRVPFLWLLGSFFASILGSFLD